MGTLAPAESEYPTAPNPAMHPGGAAKTVFFPNIRSENRMINSELQPMQAESPGEKRSSLEDHSL